MKNQLINTIRAALYVAALLSAACASGVAVTNARVNGTLATSKGASIQDEDVARWINSYIPTNTLKLLVLTQCYGGDMAKAFADKENTAVVSATSPGEEAIYGGYDAGATGAMQPGSGRTAQDVHDAGVANRDPVETPTVAGGLNPTNFPMSSVSTSGVVRSRHVILYSGQPDGRPGRDVDQDVTLKGIYDLETNTTYRAVAGSTAGGWDHDGSAKGLREAIQEAGTLITNSPNPSAEQFILFVSDHGDRHVTAAVATVLPSNLSIPFSGFPTFSSEVMNPEVLLLNTNTVPGFSVFIPFEPGGLLFEPGSEPFFPPPDWSLTITIPDQPSFPPLILTNPIELPLELNNGTVGDFPGEGLQLFFPVEKQLFIDSFFDVFVTIEVTQTTGQPWPIERVTQDSGEVPKGIAPTDGRSLLIERNPIDTEMLQLSLYGIGGILYPIQSRTSLVSGDWRTLDILPGVDLFPGTGSRLVYPLPPSTEPTRFFRALFPEPTIEQIEPAFMESAQDGSFFYISGSGFTPGDIVLIDDQPAPLVEFDAPNQLRVFPPAALAPGLYDVTVVSGNNGVELTRASDAFEISPSLARTLQAPPEWPPAGPAQALRRRRVVVAKSNPEGPPATRIDGGNTGGDVNTINTATASIAGHCDDIDNDCSGPPDHGAPNKRSRQMDGYEFGLSRRINGHALDPDSDNDGLTDALDDDSDGDGLLDLSPHSGEVLLQVVDLAVPGRGLDFVWARTYRSRAGVATSQGNRWSHSYDVRCVQSGIGRLDIFDGTGRKDTFRLQGNGTYTCPEFFREGTLDGSTGIFRLTFADTGYWEFHPFGSSPASGKLARIVDRHDNTMLLNYDSAGRLIEIIDDLGRAYTVAYTPEGKVASVTDFSGRTVSYGYAGNSDPDALPGDLEWTTSPVVNGTSTGNDFPAGKTTSYTYTSNASAEGSSLLLSVVDALGQRFVTCAYDLDPASPSFTRCVWVRRGTDAPARITYLPLKPAPHNRYAAMRCIVNDPEGNVSEYDFDTRNRCVALREYTGRSEPGQAVTANENRPAGKLRATDPDFFESHWSWNNDSLCTAWQRPRGNRIEWVYQADLDASTPPRQRGNLREERRIAHGAIDDDSDYDYDYDDDDDGYGDAIVRRFDHDPRFGSERRTGRNPQTGKEIKIAAKKVAKFKAGKALAETVKRLAPNGGGHDDNCPGNDDDCDGFVTRVLNPRGFETQFAYDANGNRTLIMQHDSGDGRPGRVDFTYNPYGQLTSITNVLDGTDQRRVDTFSYYASGPQRGYLHQMVVDAGAAGHNLTTSYEYDARGNLTRCLDPRGTATEVEVNALNQIIARQTQGAAPGERAALRCYYDANNNLVQIERENRASDGTLDPVNPYWSTAFEYDALNRITQHAHEAAHVAQQRMVVTNQFLYNANGKLIAHLLPEAVSGADPDNNIAYSYDERGLLFSRVCASGTTLSTDDVCAYDANGNLSKITRSDADTVTESTCAYDGFDRLTQIVDPMGNVSASLYDACGNRIYTRVEGELIDLPGSASNRMLAQESYTYDALNRRVGRAVSFFDPATGEPIDDGVSQTFWSYAPNGQVTASTDDNGCTTSYAYDSVGRLASVMDPKGNNISCAYDENGNLIAVLTADLSDVSAGTQIFIESFTYDAMDRCVSASDNIGNSVSNAYDSCGNLVRTTDALGNARVHTFDGLGRVIASVQYSGAQADGVVLTTAQRHYRNNRLLSTTDGNGNVTTFTYDALDRCVTLTHADGTVEVRGWNPRDKLAVYTDANGTVVSNSYDLLDRRIHREISVAAGVMDTTTFETLAYDGLGRLVAANNDASSLSFAYDSLGNLIQSTQDGLVTTSVHDGTGNRLTLSCPGGRDVLTSYDALGLPTAVSTRATADASPTTLATFAYDGSGRFAKIARNNGINTRLFWNGQENSPNAPGDFGWRQIARVNHAKAGGGKVIDQRNSTYDRNQNRTLRVMTAPWSSGGALTQHESDYDATHRLTRGTRSNSSAGDSVKSYVLDANGNRLQVTNNGLVEAYVMDNTIPPGDAQMNRYTEAPSGTFTYDSNGNRISSSNATGERVYHYDYANRLVRVDDLDGSGIASTVVTYRYSPAPVSRRLGKSTPLIMVGFSGVTSLAGTLDVMTTTYLYDYGIDQDCDGQDDDCDAPISGNLLQTYVNDELRRTFIAPHQIETSGALASISYGSVLFYHYDDQGSLRALTDAKGDSIERFDYDHFGAPLFFDAAGNLRPDATEPLTDDSPLFCGMTWNAETGLYGGGAPSPYMNKGELIDAMAKDAGYSSSRYYDPDTGKSLSRPYRGLDFQEPDNMLKADLKKLADELVNFSLSSLIRLGPSGVPGQDYNGTRSNRCSSGLAGDSGGGGWKATDYNSSRSNRKTGRRGVGGAGKASYGIATKKVAKFKAGKALADTVK